MSRRDLLLAGGLFVLMAAELATGDREQLGVHYTAGALMTLPLAARRVSPWIPVAGQVAAGIGLGAAAIDLDTVAAGLSIWATMLISAHDLTVRPAVAALAVMAVGGVGASLLLMGSGADLPWAIGIFVVPPWLLGRLLRDRSRRITELEELNARLREERERVTALAAGAERARIASDLQAVVLAGLRQMTEQAAAGERLDPGEREAVVRAFDRIRASGAEATAELRRLLGLLSQSV